ncbi:acyltransferase [Endozoicomonas numazuensis]|uniref:acyltransferase n=1 Tax=Endozoicomonas numazuensis TaxID=1137799 RepID=UPI00068CF3F4|nr:hypothetical protein [Endozoicomonas numazuensis]
MAYRISLHNIIKKNKITVKGTNCSIVAPDDYDSRLSKVKITIGGDNCKLVIGKNVRISNTQIRIKGKNNTLVLGDNCRYGGGKIYLTYGDNMNIDIGNDLSVENAYLLVDNGCSIKIGSDCMFSTGIMIRTGDKHPIYEKTSDRHLNPPQSITIGNHVWLARDVLVLKGSKISDGSVVGAKSVVSREFSEKDIILAGVPANKIKENVRWER